MQKHETETKKVSGRIIKFRAWDEEKREMFEVSGMRWKDGMVTGDDTWYGDDFLAPALRISSTLMQYTGLKDEDGQEIYEGDIVRELLWTQDQANYVFGKVHWSDNTSGFWVSGRSELTQEFAQDLEVIGNIYEHPELKQDHD